jgi:hypothetical protein
MIFIFIPFPMPGSAAVARRTIYLPESVEKLARENAREGESFSATVARLIEQGVRADNGLQLPSYIGVGEGPEDLSINAERYLAEIAEEWQD